MGRFTHQQTSPLGHSYRQDMSFTQDASPPFVDYNPQTTLIRSFVSSNQSGYLEAAPSTHSPSASLDINLGVRPHQVTSTPSRLVRMLHTPALPLDINTDIAPGRCFAMPSPTNVSLLNNFPFASPDINEPGSPLGYDLNSSILDSNLENFSNSLLDINESAETHELSFSPSSDLNLSPQESPIFQLFTGPALELGLPHNPTPPTQDPQSEDNAPPPSSAQESPPLTPLSEPPSERHRGSYADLSVEGMIQQKRDDVFWTAWFFFSQYFEPVLVGGAKDLAISLDKNTPEAGLPQIDRQVFLVQNDMENMYMWYLSARPRNALGRMQLQSYISGRHQAGQKAFPFSVAGGFVRSHKLQRKKYKGLSNPQCIHGLRLVSSPLFVGVSAEAKKRFEELTSRTLGTALPSEAADYNAWRRVSERSEPSPPVSTAAPMEPVSQTIQFLPGQYAQTPVSKHPRLADADVQGTKVAGRAPKRRKKGSGAKDGGQQNEQRALGRSGDQGVVQLGVGGDSAISSAQVERSPNLEVTQGDTGLQEVGQGTTAGEDTPTPITDLTLQWQAEMEKGQAQMWTPCSDGTQGSETAEARQFGWQSRLAGPSEEPFARQGRGRGRGLRLGTVPNSPSVEGNGLMQHRGGSRSTRQSRPSMGTLHTSNLGSVQEINCVQLISNQVAQGGTDSAPETVSEDSPPMQEFSSFDGAQVSGSSGAHFHQFQQPVERCPPAPVVAPPGSSRLDPYQMQPGVANVHTGASEALYEDEKGYLLFVSLPFTDLKQVRVTWRNVGETGIVKLDGLGPADRLLRGKRVLRLSHWGRAGGDAVREILLPTRIPDDASIAAHFSSECTGLEISVPKHAACTEERPVRLFLPEQHQLPRGS